MNLIYILRYFEVFSSIFTHFLKLFFAQIYRVIKSEKIWNQFFPAVRSASSSAEITGTISIPQKKLLMP